MTATTFTPRTDRRATGTPLTAVLVGTLVAMLVAIWTGCSTGRGSSDTVAITAAPSPVQVMPSVVPGGTPGERVVLRFGDHAVAATLADTPASRQLAAMLPLTIELSDAWGQAKAGRLPHPVSVEGAARTLKPTPRGIYYWPDTAALAVYYDDLGQSLPPPGLVQLGAVDTDVDEIAGTSRQVMVRIDRVAETPS